MCSTAVVQHKPTSSKKLLNYSADPFSSHHNQMWQMCTCLRPISEEPVKRIPERSLARTHNFLTHVNLYAAQTLQTLQTHVWAHVCRVGAASPPTTTAGVATRSLLAGLAFFLLTRRRIAALAESCTYAWPDLSAA